MPALAAPSGLSFPPLLTQWKGASQGRTFPGSESTWKKALAPRPLNVTPDDATIQDLQASAGGNFNHLQQTIKLSPQSLQSAAASTSLPAARQPGGGRGPKMQLYDSVWPGTSAPNFSVWAYTKKHGHAMPAAEVPVPRVNDMQQWFATYGAPQDLAPPGVRTEFTSLNKCVRHATNGEKSQTVKMFRGRVLR